MQCATIYSDFFLSNTFHIYVRPTTVESYKICNMYFYEICIYHMNMNDILRPKGFM